MAREVEETTVVNEEGDTAVEERMGEDTTRGISLAPPEGASPENAARAETPDTSRVGVTAAGRQAGGALMIIWTVTVGFWGTAGANTHQAMRVWTLPFRS